MTELPEEWKFLNQVPKKWETPPELRTSPRSATVNLLIKIISSALAGNDVLEAAGCMLSSYAALDAWLASEGAARLGFEGMAKTETEISFVAREVYMAWTAFAEAFGPVRRAGEGEAERSALLLAIRNGTTKLEQLRHFGEA